MAPRQSHLDPRTAGTRRLQQAPAEQRGITVSNVSVRADVDQLRTLAEHFADGTLTVPVAAAYRLRDAAAALAQATSGHAGGGAIVLEI